MKYYGGIVVEEGVFGAIERNEYENLKILLNGKAKVNCARMNENLLHIAVRFNTPEIVKLLLCNSADMSYLNTSVKKNIFFYFYFFNFIFFFKLGFNS